MLPFMFNPRRVNKRDWDKMSLFCVVAESNLGFDADQGFVPVDTVDLVRECGQWIKLVIVLDMRILNIWPNICHLLTSEAVVC